MNINLIPSIKKLKILILHYGLFASIAHATAVLLYAKLSPALMPMTSFAIYFPMIEHSIVSFICVLLGALLCFYISKKQADSK